jgi:hypothetical protein
MKLNVATLAAAFAVVGASTLCWAQVSAGARTAPPAAEVAGTCKNLTTRQERADCTKLARKARGAKAGAAGHAGRPASGTSDKLAVGAASAPINATTGGSNPGTGPNP